MIIFIILSHRALHSPMYMLICVKAIFDLVIPIFFVPNMLLNLLFNWNHISLIGCLVQMFCIHFFGSVQTTILLWMALDRFYAICTPLHYNEHMRFSAFLKFVIIPLLRNAVFISAIVGLARSLSYCQSNEIKQYFCEHMALVTLACGPIYVNNVVGLCTMFFIPAADVLLIAVSYVRIFVSLVVLHTAEVEDRWKAFHTWSTHLHVMMSFYLVGSVTFLSHKTGIDIATDINIFLGVLYINFPATVNPIIYGVRTKEIRNAVLKMFKHQGHERNQGTMGTGAVDGQGDVNGERPVKECDRELCVYSAHGRNHAHWSWSRLQ
ncbi:olfactory receptor 52K1-like [Scleropages formosus]|uniref:olfactory receptor 52K1-like n=1 Tax=Scleropages formosus TaxID=113540 RepID=UPI0010FA8F43|nr:olfactory receptor 52K1-like [Scleropages formosus]